MCHKYIMVLKWSYRIVIVHLLVVSIFTTIDIKNRVVTTSCNHVETHFTTSHLIGIYVLRPVKCLRHVV